MDAIYAARQNPKRRPKSASDIGRKPKGAFVKPPTVFGLQYRGLVDSKVEAQYDVLPKWATSTGKTKDIDVSLTYVVIFIQPAPGSMFLSTEKYVCFTGAYGNRCRFTETQEPRTA